MAKLGGVLGPPLIFAAFGLAPLPAEASCVPPSVSIDAHRARPGDVVRVRGKWWNDVCNDTGGGSIGCSDTDGGDRGRPTQGIDVDFKRFGEPGRHRVVTDIDADENFRIDVSFTVPRLSPGRYKVLVHDRGNQGYPELVLRVRTER